MDKAQAEVIRLLVDVGVKLMLSVVTTIVFIVVTAKLIFDPSWPVAVLESLLSATVYVMFKHYFPAKG